jgi:hypothetical protein
VTGAARGATRFVEDRVMHLQIRCNPAASPPDVEKLLGRLADGGVNLLGAGGSDVEHGGEFAFAVDHDDQSKAVGVLKQHKYSHRVLEVDVEPGLILCWLEDKPGELRKCLARAAAANQGSGRKVKDLLIGVKQPQGIPVQVYSE